MAKAGKHWSVLFAEVTLGMSHISPPVSLRVKQQVAIACNESVHLVIHTNIQLNPSDIAHLGTKEGSLGRVH